MFLRKIRGRAHRSSTTNIHYPHCGCGGRPPEWRKYRALRRWYDPNSHRTLPRELRFYGSRSSPIIRQATIHKQGSGFELRVTLQKFLSISNPGILGGGEMGVRFALPGTWINTGCHVAHKTIWRPPHHSSHLLPSEARIRGGDPAICVMSLAEPR